MYTFYDIIKLFILIKSISLNGYIKMLHIEKILDCNDFTLSDQFPHLFKIYNNK